MASQSGETEWRVQSGGSSGRGQVASQVAETCGRVQVAEVKWRVKEAEPSSERVKAAESKRQSQVARHVAEVK